MGGTNSDKNKPGKKTGKKAKQKAKEAKLEAASVQSDFAARRPTSSRDGGSDWFWGVVFIVLLGLVMWGAEEFGADEVADSPGQTDTYTYVP